MKRSVLIPIVLFGLTIPLLFQNCGSFRSEIIAEQVDAWSLSSLYPYSSKPTYFEDVQLVDFTPPTDGENGNIQLIGSVVYVDDPLQSLDVEFVVMDENDQLICPRLNAQIVGGANHLELLDCPLIEAYSSIKVLVRAGLQGESLEDLRSLNFNLSEIN